MDLRCVRLRDRFRPQRHWGDKALAIFEPTPGAGETIVRFSDDASVLHTDVSLSALTPVAVPTGTPDIKIVWSALEVDAMGREWPPTSISDVLLARFDSIAIADLESGIFDLALIADAVWSLSLHYVSQSVQLVDLRDASGTRFPGFDAEGTWVFAIQSLRPRFPAPVFLTILDPCTGPMDTDGDTDTSIPLECRETISFPDENLAQVVRMRAGLEEVWDIVFKDLEDLTRFNAEELGIADLEGIQCLTNLGYLYLDNNSITDISPLFGLVDLYYLDLKNNNVSDLSPLDGFNNLDTLRLENNDITDISPLSELRDLRRLYLTDNTISEIPALTGLDGLYSLDLDNNTISDVSPLSALDRLHSLSLANNGMSDLSSLVELDSVDAINLNGNDISDLAPLSALDGLAYLHLENNAVSDISPLTGLTNLRLLYLGNNNISDLSALVNNSGIDSGDSINIRDNPIDCDDDATKGNIANLEERGVRLLHDCPGTDVDSK